MVPVWNRYQQKYSSMVIPAQEHYSAPEFTDTPIRGRVLGCVGVRALRAGLLRAPHCEINLHPTSKLNPKPILKAPRAPTPKPYKTLDI